MSPVTVLVLTLTLRKQDTWRTVSFGDVIITPQTKEIKEVLFLSPKFLSLQITLQSKTGS